MNEIKDQSFISRFEFSVCCSSGTVILWEAVGSKELPEGM